MAVTRAINTGSTLYEDTYNKTSVALSTNIIIMVDGVVLEPFKNYL